MRFRLLIIACVAGFALANPHHAQAFGYDGHRVVCAIAWDGLRPRVREKVAAIIGRSVPGKTGRAAFAESCLWADTLGLTRPELRPEHYINVPRGAARIDMDRDCPPDKKCVLRAIEFWQLALRAATTRDARRDALRFISHYVGDIHQPLHTGYVDDLGGNAIKGTYVGKQINLHAVWDYGMMEATAEPWAKMVRRLERDITRSNRRSWTVTGPGAWADESFIGARSPQALYTPETAGFSFDASYGTANLPIIEERLKMAGVRLTQVLERTLTSPRR